METLRPRSCQVPHSASTAAFGPANRDRRSVLRLLFGSAFGCGLAALGAAGGLWTAALARFFASTAAEGGSAWRKIGAAGDFLPGSVTTKYKDALGVWVVHAVYCGRRQIYALRATCTHLGCVVLWDEAAERFRCPCHGSGFDRRGMQLRRPRPAAAGTMRQSARRTTAAWKSPPGRLFAKNLDNGTIRRAMSRPEPCFAPSVCHCLPQAVHEHRLRPHCLRQAVAHCFADAAFAEEKCDPKPMDPPQILKSVFRHPAPVDRRGRVAVVLENFFLHIHPTAVPKHALRLRFTWCMGGSPPSSSSSRR